MSFVSVGPRRKKRSTIRRRPGWDDSVNDLTVFKATPEEVYLRKEAHKSKNHISVKLEKLRKERQRSKLTGAETQQLAIMKEVLYDQHELQKVLAKSDTMMAVVKDLFGDDPKRFAGFPNVTNAPQVDGDSDRSSSLVASVPDIYTRTEKLSDSVMGRSALNDIETESDSDADSGEEADQPNPISYQSKLNLQRFRDFLQAEEKLTASHVDPPSLVSELTQAEPEAEARAKVIDAHAYAPESKEPPHQDKDKSQMVELLAMLMSQSGSNQMTKGDETPDIRMLRSFADALVAKRNEENGFKTPPKNQQQSRLPSDRTPPSAINDTKKLKKTKRCTKVAEGQTDAANTSATMNGMRQALQDLEGEIAAYEHQTGRRPQEESDKTETFSGYTIALVSTVSRLTKYLKETDLRVRAEVTLREQLTQDVYQLRTIIDALATDIILTQEEYGKLYSEHQRYKDNTTAALVSVNNQLRDLRQMVTGRQSDGDPDTRQQQASLSQQGLNTSNSSRKTNESRTSTPIHSQQDSSNQSGSGSYRPLPSEVRPTTTIAAVTSAAAVMLSPPVRKTRVQANDTGAKLVKQPSHTQQQSSLVNVSDITKPTAGELAHSVDPPHLTQTPPIMNTVSVPRPIPLVQTNIHLPLQVTDQRAVSLPSNQPSGKGFSQPQQTNGLISNKKDTTTVKQMSDLKVSSREQDGGDAGMSVVSGPNLTDLVKLGDETEEQLHRLQELAIEEAMNNPALQELMQTQIAELNRQQEEARKRLLDLLDKQKTQQMNIQKAFQDPQMDGSDMASLHHIQGQARGRTAPQKDGHLQVSPPISPIPQLHKERDAESVAGRGIIVSLPVVDLDVSGASLTSPNGYTQIQTVE